MKPSPQIFVVIGDVHDAVRFALESLHRLEEEQGILISQLFAVGDLGLFLDEADWDFLTGPSKYRRPERSEEIRLAWDAWPWPLAAVGGNHEAWGRLRDFDPKYFGNKLSYANAGLLEHKLPGLRVAGISGIGVPGTNPARNPPVNKTWRQIMAAYRYSKLSPKALSHYRPADIEAVLKIGSAHVVLTHDWPVDPPHCRTPGLRRPEMDIIKRLRPIYHFCGHHHRPAVMRIGNTETRALNIIARDGQDWVNPGWAWIGSWDGAQIIETGFWPLLSTADNNK